VENPVEKDLKSGEKEHLAVEKFCAKPKTIFSPTLVHRDLPV
jgi:hypothetical protein